MERKQVFGYGFGDEFKMAAVQLLPAILITVREEQSSILQHLFSHVLFHPYAINLHLLLYIDYRNYHSVISLDYTWIFAVRCEIDRTVRVSSAFEASRTWPSILGKLLRYLAFSKEYLAPSKDFATISEGTRHVLPAKKFEGLVLEIEACDHKPQYTVGI